MLGNALWWDSLLPLALLGGLVWLALLLRLRPVPDRAIRIVVWVAFVACLLALGSIIAPRRPYLHYWQLLLLPGVFLLGSMIARLLASAPPRWQRTERWLVMLAAAGLLGTLLLHRSRSPNSFVGDMAYYRQFPRTELAARVASFARPGEALAIWGRTDNVYVETGLRQATRDSHFGSLVETGPLQQYVRERYLVDLVHTNPESFLDSSGSASPHYTGPEYAHDHNYRELAAVVRANYVLVEKFAGSRLYRRRDLVTR